MSFAAWKPESVAAYCAYSFAWWNRPPENLNAPALIVCGQSDGTRCGSSLAYFQEGRRQGKPWAWGSLAGRDHEPSPELDSFVRAYFSEVVGHEFREFSRIGKEKVERASSGVAFPPSIQKAFVENMTERAVEGDRAKDVGVSVLPSAGLLEAWRELHHP